MVSPDWQYEERFAPLELAEPWHPDEFGVMDLHRGPFSACNWYRYLFLEHLPWFRAALDVLPGRPIDPRHASFFMEDHRGVNARVGVSPHAYISLTPALFLLLIKWGNRFAAHVYRPGAIQPLSSLIEEWHSCIEKTVDDNPQADDSTLLYIASENFASEIEREFSAERQEYMFSRISFGLAHHFFVHHEIGHLVSGQIPRLLALSRRASVNEAVSEDDDERSAVEGPHAVHWCYELIADDRAIDHLCRNFVLENTLFPGGPEGMDTIYMEDALGIGTTVSRGCAVAVAMMGAWGIFHSINPRASSRHPAPVIRTANCLARLLAASLAMGNEADVSSWMEQAPKRLRPLEELGLIDIPKLGESCSQLGELMDLKLHLLDGIREHGMEARTEGEMLHKRAIGLLAEFSRGW